MGTLRALPAGAAKAQRAPAALPPGGRAHATRPSAADRYLTPMEAVLQHRAQRRRSSPVLNFRVAGVTFEGRQEAVAQLTPGGRPRAAGAAPTNRTPCPARTCRPRGIPIYICTRTRMPAPSFGHCV